MRISDWSSDVCSSDLAMPSAGIQPGERSKQEQHNGHGSAEHPMLPSEAKAAGRCGLVLRLRYHQNACHSETSTAIRGSPGCGLIGVPTSNRIGPKLVE